MPAMAERNSRLWELAERVATLTRRETGAAGLNPSAAAGSVAGYGRIHVARPRVDAAGERGQAPVALLPQEFERAQAAHAVMAVQHHIPLAVDLAEALRQTAQRDQLGARDVRDLVLVRLAHVDQQQVLPPFLPRPQLERRDLVARGPRRPGRRQAAER